MQKTKPLEKLLKVSSLKISLILRAFKKEHPDFRKLQAEYLAERLSYFLRSDSEKLARFKHETGQPFLNILLKTKSGNCIALATLYKILATRLNLDCRIAFHKRVYHAYTYVYKNGRSFLIDPTYRAVEGDKTFTLLYADYSYDDSFLVEDNYLKIWLDAITYFKIGKFRESLKAYRAFIAKYEEHALTWSNYGVVLKHLYESEQAEAAFRSAIETNHNSFAGWYNLARLFHETNRIDDAKRAYVEALRIAEQQREQKEIKKIKAILKNIELAAPK